MTSYREILQEFKIDHGRILIQELRVMHLGATIFALEIECFSKYFDVMVGAEHQLKDGEAGPSLQQIFLWSNDYTLRVNHATDKITTITLPARYADWHLVSDQSRYTAYIAGYKHRRGHVLWHAAEGGSDES